MFKAFGKELNEKITFESEHNPLLASHLGKFESLFASLTLILFYSDKVIGEITDITIPKEYAIKAKSLCDFYEYQAKKIYDIEEEKERKKEMLSDKIISKVEELQKEGKLPISISQLSQKIRGAKNGDIKEVLKDIALFKGSKIMRMKK